MKQLSIITTAFMVLVAALFVNSCEEEETGPVPTVDFSIDKDNYKYGTELQFTNKTEANGADIKGYRWNFGDGNFSNEENPTHTYEEGGDFTVELTVTYKENTIIENSKSVRVIGDLASVNPTGLTIYQKAWENESLPVELYIVFRDSDENTVNYRGDFGYSYKEIADSTEEFYTNIEGIVYDLDKPNDGYTIELRINEDGGDVYPDDDPKVASYMIRTSYLEPDNDAGPYESSYLDPADEEDPRFEIDLEWVEEEE